MEWADIIRELAGDALRKVAPLLPKPPDNLPRTGEEAKDRSEKIDRVCEHAILEGLKSRRIACVVVSEDIGTVQVGGGSNYHVVVDPVDGTTNASRGIPYSAISIAVSENSWMSGVFTGIVVNVYTGEVFTATRGQGAYRNGTPIRASSVKELKNAVVSVDLSKYGKSTEWMRKIAPKVSAIRSFGSASIELAYVAMGLTDAHADLRWMIRPVDVAAGILVLEEAGGAVYTRSRYGEKVPLKPKEPIIVVGAANRELLNKILEIIGEMPAP